MDDTMRIKEKYIPKKFWNLISSIEVDADFDYGKNRTYQHYFISMKNGDKFDAKTIKEMVDNIKKYIN